MTFEEIGKQLDGVVLALNARFDTIDARLDGIEKDVRDTRQVLNVDERLENLKTVRDAPASGGGLSGLSLAAKGKD